MLPFRKFLDAQEAAELRPEPGFEGAHREILSVPAGVDVVVRPLTGQYGLPPTRRAPGEVGIAQLEQHHVEQRIHHGEVDRLALAGALFVKERHQDGEGSADSPRVVGDRDAGNLRRSVGLARHVGNAGQTLVVEIVGDDPAVGALLAEARERDADDVALDLAKGLVVEAQALRHAGPKAFHDDVDGRDDLLEHLTALRLLQVEANASRVAADDVGNHEFLAALAGRLQLDDVGAEVAEDLGAVRSGPEAREIQDPHGFEGELRLVSGAERHGPDTTL